MTPPGEPHRSLAPALRGGPARAPGHRRPRGATLLELALALAILGLLAGAALAASGRALDRRAVRTARETVVAALADARRHAVTHRLATALHVDEPAGRLAVAAGPDTLAVHDLAATLAVQLAATRDSTAYDAFGLGVGAANTTISVRRGSAAETVWVARLGRVRWE